ncbi:MAG: hypothetical protein JNJ69_11255 [Leptospiraceae bacterium]|nr:hypothetical protein [Leptospiraceae bacterium]
MKAKTIISAFAVLWLLSPLAAQEEESEYRRETAKRPKAQADCSEHPFGAGCMGFGLGPVISSDGKGVVYGAGANFTYFLIDRLGAGVHGGAIFGSGYQDYSVGPGITYYIGPFGGYLLTPSLTATRHFLRGDFNVEGWSYGPSIGLMARLTGPIYWGISVGYYTFQVPGYKSSDWSWSPVIFIPF